MKLTEGHCRKPFKITVSYTVQQSFKEIYCPCDSLVTEQAEDDAFNGAEKKLDRAAARYCKKGTCNPGKSCTPDIGEETITYSTSEQIIETQEGTYKICYLTCTITVPGECICL